MVSYDGLEIACKNNPALKFLIKTLIDQANLQAQNIGTDPTASQQSTRQQRTSVPGLARMAVTGDDGHFIISISNPADANGEIYHEIQSSSTLPFSTSQDLVTYGPSPATSRTVNDPSKTYFWRWRSKYFNSAYNRWQQLPDAVNSGEVRSIAMATLNTRQVVGETPLVQSGTSKTVLVQAFTARLGDVLVSYNATTVDVGAYDNYIIYVTDPHKVGGAQTFLATLDPLVANSSDGNFIVGTIAMSSQGGGLGVAYSQQFQSSCVIAGTQVRLFGGADVAVETLVAGDVLLGVDGGQEAVVRVTALAARPVWSLTTQTGKVLLGACSHHLLYSNAGPLPVSLLQLGDQILVRVGTENQVDFVTAKTLGGALATVYRVITDRTKTYLTDGVWSRDLGGGVLS